MDQSHRTTQSETTKQPEPAKVERPSTSLKVRSAAKRGAHTLTGR